MVNKTNKPATKKPVTKKTAAKKAAPTKVPTGATVDQPADTTSAASGTTVDQPANTTSAAPDATVDQPAEVGNDLSTINGVATYLALPGIDVNVKLAAIGADAIPVVSVLTRSLLGFAEEFAPGKPEQSPTYVLGKLYNLYNTLQAAVNTEDNDEFNIKMDIINLVFRANYGHNEAFHPTLLLRYDYLWAWGDVTLKTHQVLCTLICALADRSTREVEIKKINIDNSYARDGLSISQDKFERLIRYYS